MTGLAGHERLQPDAGSLRQEVQLATFRVGTSFYAIDILRIKEIIRPQKLTPVPNAPPFIEGVINLRGAVIPIVDLRKRFSLPVTIGERSTRMIICTVSHRLVGLVVDEVVEVRLYRRDELQPAPTLVKGEKADFFLGVGRRGEDLLMILDLERILLTSEMIDAAPGDATPAGIPVQAVT